MRELEVAGAAALGSLAARGHGAPPEPGAVCANCGAGLQGPFCHDCGQNFDTHKRSVWHLIVESVENLFHLDGRLRRTLPDLFFRPGRLSRDYMEGRVARHVPPFRTFLVALLLFVFAAEYATHEITQANARQAAVRAAALKTPQGRAAESARMRAEAVHDRDSDLKEAADDRAGDLKDPDENRARIAASYARQTARTQARFAAKMAAADRVASGLPPAPPAVDTPTASKQGDWLRTQLHKATANPEYYLTVMFTWGHRFAIVLLPIIGLTLAVVYLNRRRYFIYDHLLVAMNFLSFVFLATAFGLILPPVLMPWWLGLVAIWVPVNLYQTLRGAYGSSVMGAVFKTFVVWSTAWVAFTLLLTGLLVFTLAQI